MQDTANTIAHEARLIYGMTFVEWATIISALATTIYTIGTFMLWWATKRTLQLTQQKLDADMDALRASFVQNVFKNFREVYASVLKEYEINILADAQNKTPSTIREEYLASFLINQSYEIFLLVQKGLVPNEFKESAYCDIQDLFKLEFIRKRWEQVSRFHASDFQHFVYEIVKE